MAFPKIKNEDDIQDFTNSRFTIEILETVKDNNPEK